MKKKIIAAVASILFSAQALTMTAFADGTASSGSSNSTAASGAGCSTSYIIMMVVLLIVMYFLLIRPQKKKEKETKNLQDSVQVGDEIVTIGGIVGIVVKKGNDNVVIETGGDKHKIRIKKWAISENVTVKEKMEAETAKTKAEKKSLFGKKKDKDSDENSENK